MPLMKTNRQKSNWMIDALLFTGLLVSFALDWTGLPTHQWVGVFGGLLAVYHLVIHWNWVTAVTLRFFGKTSGQARTYYLLDALILLGFYVILVSGLLISTWLDLPLTNYAAVKDFHVITSIVTLVLVVLKIGLHWRWIVNVARQHVFRPVMEPVPVVKPVPAAIRAPASGAMTRADFLKLMGIVGAASLVAVTFTLNNNVDAQASGESVDSTTNSVTDSTSTLNNVTATQEVIPTATVQPTATETVTVSVPTATTTQSLTQVQPYTSQTTACIVRCNKHCSYPGRCRKYQDTNGNNLCDLGECM